MDRCSFPLRRGIVGCAVAAWIAFGAGLSAAEAQGDERLVWDQPASSAGELAGLAYVAYVDGRRQRLSSVSCGSEPGPDGYECSSALPSLASGEHVVQIAAYPTSRPQSEGYRSAVIRIRLGNQAPGGVIPSQLTEQAPVPARGMAESGTVANTGEPVASQAVTRTWTTGDGVRLQAAVVGSGLEDPTGLLPLPDGRILVAERGGRVRVFRDGILLPAPAVTLDDVAVGDGRGLLAIASGHDFATTGHVFAVYTTADGLRVARLTERGDTLVDHAVLLEGLPVAAAWPAALLRSGPDGRLYIALDDGGDAERVADMGSYSGKVLRLQTDGTTPADHPGRSPVWSVGVGHPVGLAWSADGTTLRLVGETTAPETSPLDSRPGVARFTLPREFGATSVIVSGPSLHDSLLVASASERGILRVWFAGADAPGGSEWLVRDLPGPVTALASAADGSIYVTIGPTLLRVAVE